MVTAKESVEGGDATRRKVFIAVGLLTAIIIALMVYWATRPRTPNNTRTELHLENALRAGSPEFEQLRQKLVVEFVPDNDAFESTSALGGLSMTMRPKVRNFTGRTLGGLELQATVVDLEGQPVQSRAYVFPRPGQAFELENNKVFEPLLVMEGFKKEQVRANIRVEVTGLTVK